MACITGRLKGGTTEFLDLVDQKGQDHKKPKSGGQMVLTMSIIMFYRVTLVLERVEGFILDLPACATSFHNRKEIDIRQLEIRDPAEVQDPIFMDFPVFQKIDQ